MLIQINLPEDLVDRLGKEPRRSKLIAALLYTEFDSKITLEEGYIFDISDNTLYTPSRTKIELTKLQTKLMYSLATRKGELVDYKTIANEAWKGKNCSIYTMRNQIKAIRDKTCYEIIKNHSNKGYEV